MSCAHDIDPTVLDPIHHFHRYMVVSGEGLKDEHRVPHMFGATPGQRWSPSREYVGMVFHGSLVTHLDALSHMAWDARTYNGYPAERVNSVSGAIDLPVSAVTAGVTGRGVLFDVPRSRGVDALPPGTAVEVDEIERMEAEQEVVVGEGDIVFLRTGPAAGRGRVDARRVELAGGQVGLGRQLPALDARAGRGGDRPRRLQRHLPCAARLRGGRAPEPHPRRDARDDGPLDHRQHGPRRARPDLRPAAPVGVPGARRTHAAAGRDGQPGQPGRRPSDPPWDRPTASPRRSPS